MRDPDRARSLEASAGAAVVATDSPRHRTSRLPSSRSWTSTRARTMLRRPLTGPELQDSATEPDRVVGRDDPAVLEATDPIEVEVVRQRPIGDLRTGGLDAEADIEPSQEARQVRIGRRDRRDPLEAQLGHEPALDGLPHALDPTLALR